MEKVIHLEDSVYQICSEYPIVIDILEELGFTDIVKPGMLNTMGRFMTLSKGSRIKGIPMDRIEKRLSEAGFRLERSIR